MRPLALRLLVLCAASAGFACADPVHDAQVSALGPETPGVSKGPEHRPGQPCLVCHGGQGPGGTRFSVAGTVYAVKGDPSAARPAGVANVIVHLIDVNNAKHDATTNAVGTFYVPFNDWVGQEPIRVSLEYKTATATMNTHIGTDGSCASCHFGAPGPATPGPVYLVVDPADLP